MPDALKFPGMLRAVVKLVRRQWRGGGVIGEFVAFALRHAARARFSGGRSRLVPGVSSVVGALDDLPEPTAGLRNVNAVGINRRSLHMVNFPSGKVRA